MIISHKNFIASKMLHFVSTLFFSQFSQHTLSYFCHFIYILYKKILGVLMHKFFSYKRAAFFLLCPFLSFFAAGCQNTSTVQDENSAFRKFTHTLFCQEVSSDTLTLHYTLQKPQTYGIKMCIRDRCGQVVRTFFTSQSR